MNQQSKEILGWYAAMADCELSDAEREELAAWEEENLGRGLATSDWPGWAKHIGPHPRATVLARGPYPGSPPIVVRVGSPETDGSEEPKEGKTRLYRRVLLEQNGKCFLCLIDEWQHGRRLHLHRILPGSQGGEYIRSNVVLVCNKCHAKCEGKTIEEIVFLRDALNGALVGLA